MLPNATEKLISLALTTCTVQHCATLRRAAHTTDAAQHLHTSRRPYLERAPTGGVSVLLVNTSRLPIQTFRRWFLDTRGTPFDDDLSLYSYSSLRPELPHRVC